MRRKMTQNEVMEVVKRIYTRTWGWPDGTQFCGMEAETVNKAMEILMDDMKKNIGKEEDNE